MVRNYRVVQVWSFLKNQNIFFLFLLDIQNCNYSVTGSSHFLMSFIKFDSKIQMNHCFHDILLHLLEFLYCLKLKMLKVEMKFLRKSLI